MHKYDNCTSNCNGFPYPCFRIPQIHKECQLGFTVHRHPSRKADKIYHYLNRIGPHLSDTEIKIVWISFKLGLLTMK